MFVFEMLQNNRGLKSFASATFCQIHSLNVLIHSLNVLTSIV